MPSLREEITKTFRRLGRRDRTIEASRAETVLASDPREGKDFGSYRILRRLGLGGMGRVYLALDARLGRYAALKFLDPNLTSRTDMLGRLYQEARAASSLNHPNILTIYEIGEAEGEHFIASEYVEGVTLRAALDRRLITPRTAVEIATQVASALVPAHEAGIVHRDLKASNIMIRPDGLVKVIDFGLAKLSDERSADGPLSTVGGVTGTVEYMSPEQARGEAVDQRTDLWSLGVVLHEMLAGKLPFEGFTDSHVIVGILDREIPPMEVPASLPQTVTAIIERALTKDRNKRYQSAAEMIEDLHGLGVSKQRISAIKQFTETTGDKKRGRLVVLAAAGGILLVAAAVWWFPLHGRERVLGPEWFEPGPAEQVTFDGNVKTAAISPDGKYLAYTSRTGGGETLHIRDLKAKTEWQLPAYTESTPGLTFSADSEWLYYVLKDQREWGRLYSVSVRGGLPKMQVDDIDGPVAFSPDGKRFAFMRRSEEKRTSVEKIVVSEVNDTGNQHEIVQKINTHIGRKLSWSEGRDQIAAVIFNTGLHAPLQASLSFFGPDGAPRGTPLMNSHIRSMGAPTWIGASGVLAFGGVTVWRTNYEAQLWEASAGSGEMRAFSSPTLANDSMSATRRGDTLAAIQRTREAVFWIADKQALDSPRTFKMPRNTDTSGFDFFAWGGGKDLIFPAMQARSINLFRLKQSGEEEQLTATTGCVEQAPVYAQAKAMIVYSSNCSAGGGDYNLWKLDLATGQKAQLTSGSNLDEEPDVTRDGKWIVYWTNAITPSLWKIPMEGGTPQQLSNLQVRHPVVSADGKGVLCQVRESYDGRWRYAVLSLADGTIEKELGDLPVSEVRARWAANGQAIDFRDAEGTRIWRKMLAGGGPTPLIGKTADPIMDFAWSADGSQLAFVTIHASSDAVLFRRKVAYN
jgi:Tol biopolymer transport system component